MVKRRAVTLSASQYMQQVRLPGAFHADSTRLADDMVRDAVRRYEQLLHEQHGRVDQKQWRQVKEKHQMAVYRSVGKAPAGKTPDVLAIGGIPGSLEDVMYGVVNLTPEAMHIENAVSQGDLTDSRILAILAPPTANDPFTSLTVKWVLRNHDSMSKQRDYVYIEATGMTTTSTGERLGYLLVHSVTLAAVPEFRKDSRILRGQLSYCYLYRQRRQHGVDMLFHGNVNPLGGVKERVALSLAINMAMAAPTCVDLAMMKKLTFSLRTSSSSDSHSSSSRGSSHSSSRSRSLGSNGSFLRRLTTLSSASEERSSNNGSFLGRVHSQSDSMTNACGLCSRVFGALKTKAKCQLCCKLICSRCRVIKRVISYEDSILYPEKLEFCTDCVVNTSNTSAMWMAAQDLQQIEHMIQAMENDSSKANSAMNRDATKVRKPIWELNGDDRQTMSTEFSTRSSSGSRYNLNSINMSIQSDDRRSRDVADMEDVITEQEDTFASSGHDYFTNFVLADDEHDEEEDMPMIDSFVDDEFPDDEADEIFFSVEEEKEHM